MGNLNKTFRLIEDRDIFFFGGILFLEETGEIQGQHVIPDPAVFLFRYLSHETRDGDTGSGNILAHEADGGAERKVIFDPGKKFHAFPGETGKNQMADENTAEQDAVF